MINKTELKNDIDSAKQAEAILSHPMFIASTKLLRQLTVEKFEGLGFTDISQMQECNVRLNLIEELESNLAVIIRSGEASFRALEEIQTFEQEIKNER